MTVYSFNSWKTEIKKQTNCEWTQLFPQKKGEMWGFTRLILDGANADAPSLPHKMGVVMDLKTGDLYLDCSRKKIYAKNTLFTLLRPAFMVIETLYHALGIETIKQIYLAYKGKQSKSETLKKILLSLLSIVWIPLVSLLMQIVHILTIGVGLVVPKSLGAMRKFLGQLQKVKRFGQNNFGFECTPCFEPFVGNIAKEHKWGHGRTLFQKTKTALEKFTNEQIEFQKDPPLITIINPFLERIGTHERFVSSALQPSRGIFFYSEEEIASWFERVDLFA